MARCDTPPAADPLVTTRSAIARADEIARPQGGGARAVRDVADVCPSGWDALTVEPPGGHVLQGSIGALRHARHGWTPRFVRFDDGRAALVALRRRPPLPGVLAYAPRGPVAAGDDPVAVAGRAIALAAWLRNEGATILAVDPVLDASEAYENALREAGFREAEEIQVSRHRLVLELPPGATEASLLASVATGTRQRIRAAERHGTVVREDAAGQRLEAFEALLEATAARQGFDFVVGLGFLTWWRELIAAGQGLFLVAEQGETLIGGLFLVRQGGCFAMAHSADRVDLRAAYPGTMHRLHWEAIRRSLAAGMPALDFGGVDVAGNRGRPEPGDAMWGLYEHKRSFGATWRESAPAHEIVLRPALYRAERAARALLPRIRRRALRSGPRTAR